MVKAVKTTSIRMEFEDNGTLARLTGEHNHNLARLEKALDVSLDSFGNSITVSGPAPEVKTCLLYTSPSPRDRTRSRMPSSA